MKTPATSVSASDGLVGVDISWTQPIDTKAAQVWRFQGKNGLLIATVKVPPYHDAGAIAGVHYEYGIRLQGLTGPFGAFSMLDSGYATNLPPPPPTPPQDPPTGVTLMPPATIINNTDGAWTLDNSGMRRILLNGVDTGGWMGDGNGNIGGNVVKVGDTMFIDYVTAGYVWVNIVPIDGTTKKSWHPAKLGITNDPTPNTDPVARVTAKPAPYIGPSNKPDIFDLKLTGYPAVQAITGYPVPDPSWNSQVYNAVFFAEPTYGFPMMRFTNNPNKLLVNDDSGSVLLAWFLQFGQRDKVHTRWLMRIKKDVAAAFTEVGVKLPGPSCETGTPVVGNLISWRQFHGFPQAGTYPVQDYLYDAAHPGPTGRISDFGINYVEEHLYCVEVACYLNTFTNGVANADGYGAVWLDGHKIFETFTELWTADTLTKLRSLHFNFYHGGHWSPRGIMTYEVGEIAASTSYIGVPAVMVTGPSTPSSTGPAWRQGMKIGQFSPIPGTAMSRLPVDFYTVDGYQGMAATSTSAWFVLAGGHVGWQNKAIELDITVDAPKFVVRNQGSDGVQSDAVRAGPPPIYTYADGKPCGSQTYSWNQHIPPLNRVMRLAIAAPHNLVPNPINIVDGFRLSDCQYDTQGTFAPGIIWDGFYHSSVAKHPTTHIVYIGNEYGQFFSWDWSKASATVHGFTALSIPGAPAFGRRGSFVDGPRNRWGQLVGDLHWNDVSDPANLTYHSLSLTDSGDGAAAAFVADSNGSDANEPSGVVHDTDRDLYIALCNNGKVYSVTPTGLVKFVQQLPDIPHKESATTSNGWNNRIAMIQGGILCVPNFNAPAYFMPTR